MDWSKMDVDSQNSHVQHVQHPHHQWRLPNFWHRQNVPKVQSYQPPRTQRHRAKPPELLRLNSVGESVEEFPNSNQNRRQFCSTTRPPQAKPNLSPQRSNPYFLGNIWSKVSQPLRTKQHLARTVRSPQRDIDLDHLVEKFAVNCEMEQQKFQPNVGHQEVGQRPHPMTFNGGPYITWASKDHSPRTFPAYYRFLNLAHFHPYNNTARYYRTNAVPPFQQQPFKSAWSGIAQLKQSSNKNGLCHHHDCQPINGACLLHSASHVRKSNVHHQQSKQTKTRNNNRMMQNNYLMSHQQGHQSSSSVAKPASPHESETKKRFCHKHRLRTTQVNAASVQNGTSVHCTKDSSKGDVCSESKDQSRPCKTTLSQSELPDAITKSNTSPDKRINNQEGHTDSSPRLVCKKSACKNLEGSDCLCSSKETAKHFELKLETCNNESETKPDVSQEEKEVELKEQTTNAAEPGEVANEKQMHSSIAYLLGDYVNGTPTCSNDSDFGDVDVEDLDEIDDNSRELFNSFHPSDQYNPLYGWKCHNDKSGQSQDYQHQPNSERESSTDFTLTFNDSGTVLGQTSDETTSSNSLSDESDSEDSDSDSSEWSDSGCDDHEEEQRIWDSFKHTNDPYDPMGGCRLQPSSLLRVAKGTATVSLEQELEEAVPHSENQEAAPLKNKLCSHSTSSTKMSSARHPSVAFILSDSDTPDVSDADESDDFQDSSDVSSDYDKLWQSFDSSSDPYNPINGYKCRTPSSIHRSASSPSELCNTGKQAEQKFTYPDAKTDAVQQTPHLSTNSSNVSLKQSSSTGCLKKVWKKAMQRDKETKERVKKVCTMTYVRAFQLKSTAGCTPVGRVLRLATWSKTKGSL